MKTGRDRDGQRPVWGYVGANNYSPLRVNG